MESRSMLQNKLRQSVLLTTGLSLFLLTLALVLIAWLGKSALKLAQVEAPTVRHTEKLQLGVEESQQKLLHWVALGGEKTREERREVWSRQILPSLHELQELSRGWTADERAELIVLRDRIYTLEALQWWVEDTAQASGNRAGVYQYIGEAQRLYRELNADLSFLVNAQVVGLGNGVVTLSALQAKVGAANAAFADFLLSGNVARYEECRSHLREVGAMQATLSQIESKVPGAERSRWMRLRSNLTQFGQEIGEAHFHELSAEADQAKSMIDGEIAKTTEAIQDSLTHIDRREIASLEAGGKAVENLTWLAMIGLPLFMLATGFVAVRNARQLYAGIVVPIRDLVKVAKAVNQGNYDERVEVRSDDEVGLLSSSFNNMAESFLEITDVAIAVACGDFSKRLEAPNERDWLRAAINSMNNKLVEVADQARRIADGDYSSDFTPMSDRDELGHAIKQMTDNLRESTAKLATSEARSSAVIRTAQDGIITIGEDRIIHSFNPAAEKMFGYTSDEIVKQSISRLMTEEDNRTGEGAGGHDTRQGGRELVARRKDGSTFPVMLSIGEAVVDDKRLYTGIVRDLTKEKEARAERDRYLREQEDQNWFKSQLSRIYDASQGITDPRVFCKTILSELAVQLNIGQALFYCVEDPGEREVLQLYAAYGYTVEEDDILPLTVGKNGGLVGECAQLKKVIRLTDVPEGYLRITSGLGGQKPAAILLLPVLFKQTLLGVLELATFDAFTPVQGEYLDQMVLTVGAILKGVMEQKRTEELLLVTQEQGEGLRVQQEELRVSNEELKRQTDQLQASEEELRVQQVELGEANEQLKENAKNLEEHNEMLNSRNAELEIAREAIRLKAEELENASKYKSQFLANMSHELRTPLNSILVLAKLLQENKPGTLDKKQEKFAFVIHKSGHDLLGLINEILDLSKIEAGMLEFEWTEVPLKEIQEDMGNLFGEVGRSRKLNFEIVEGDGCPETLRTDKGRLEQVIKNLISNAFKFTPEGGTVELSLRTIEEGMGFTSKDLRNSASVVAIAVRDTGIGIPPDKHQAVFESFQQADGSTSRKYGGTGLGLSISRGLVHRMGGEIRLESEDGLGSTFTICLPVEGPSEPAREKRDNKKTGQADGSADGRQTVTNGAGPAEHAATASNGSVPRVFGRSLEVEENVDDDREIIEEGDLVVLIIEDNTDFASVVLECAREREFRGIIATDGRIGLELARQQPLNAVLLDIELPTMDGWGVLMGLKSDEKLSSLPIFVMSGLELKERAMGLGAAGFLQKPVTSEQLDAVFADLTPPDHESLGQVLIIEDDEGQSFAVRELLKGRGFSTSSAFSGEHALKKLSRGTIELVILDLGLPDMSGLDLLDRIRENEATESIPIIVLTGREMEKEEVGRIQQHGGSIILKTKNSDQRLIDETALCLRKLVDEGQVVKPARTRAANCRTVLENKTVLLVDDDERNIVALSSLLEEQQMKVIPGRNGREGIELLDRHRNIDLVLMDVMMPEMDGYEAIRKIRNQPRFSHLPIIAVTAKAMKGDREASLDAGASEYISKPVDADKLLTLISVWLYR